MVKEFLNQFVLKTIEIGHYIYITIHILNQFLKKYLKIHYNSYCKKLMLLSMISIVFLSGCLKREICENYQPTEEAYQTMNISKSNVSIEEYNVMIQDDEYRLSLYEPLEGCYVGADILYDKTIHYDIEEFEKIMGEHCIYKYNFNIDDEFPERWILSCMSLTKTPYVVLDVMNSEGEIDWKKIEKMAKKFDEYYIPTFVAFEMVDVTISPQKYIESFKATREIFKKYASNVSFVWYIDIKDVNVSKSYYPGNEWVDWVGIDIVETLNGEKEYYGDIFNGIDFFYYTFQNKKPIMISSLAVSHLSDSDYIYRADSAAMEINRIYKNIETNYPRIKGIIYVDINEMDYKIYEEKKDDFTITSEENITKAYKEAISTKYFTDKIDVFHSKDETREYYKSPFKAYKIGDNFYFDVKVLTYDLGINDAEKHEDIKVFRGNEYISSQELEEKNGEKVEVDEGGKIVVLK